jgi:hypothetical protein
MITQVVLDFFGNGSENYSDRQKHINIAEVLFVEWSKNRNYKINRIGFDEKDNSVHDFFKLNALLRNLPDFVISRDGKSFVVNVKGTANIKRKEYDLIPKLIDCFSSDDAPLIYAFCFKDKAPIFKTATAVINLFDESIDRKWSDGVVYRNINLEK